MTETKTASPRMAPVDGIMFWSILASGALAAVTTHPQLWLVTPVIAILTMNASKRANNGEIVAAVRPRLSEFPSRVEIAVQDAIDQLPAGDARKLLSEVVREARPLFASASGTFDESKDNEARGQAGELVLAACDTALELAHLDAVLDARTGPGSTGTARDMSLLNRFSAARELFATRLSDAASALAALYASGVERGTPASDRVAELVTDLKADAVARSAAKRELDELLSPEPPVG